MGKREKKPEASAPLWMCTFGDLMSLLLCFFIMLYAISIIAEPRFEALADTLNQDFTGFSGSARKPIRAINTITEPAESAARDRRVAALTGGQPVPGPAGASTHVRTVPFDGTPVREGVILFELGNEMLTAQAQWNLRNNILPILQGSPQKIMVKGYSAPIETGETGGSYEGNDLAFYRALNVVAYLVELGLAQEFFEVSYEPGGLPSSVPGGTIPEHAGASVEIILLNQTQRSLRQ